MGLVILLDQCMRSRPTCSAPPGLFDPDPLTALAAAQAWFFSPGDAESHVTRGGIGVPPDYAADEGLVVNAVAVGGVGCTGPDSFVGQVTRANGGRCYEVSSSADAACLREAVASGAGPERCEGAGTLPRTGGEVSPLMVTAAVLLVLGGALLLLARRRREALVG